MRTAPFPAWQVYKAKVRLHGTPIKDVQAAFSELAMADEGSTSSAHGHGDQLVRSESSGSGGGGSGMKRAGSASSAATAAAIWR